MPSQFALVRKTRSAIYTRTRPNCCRYRDLLSDEGRWLIVNSSLPENGGESVTLIDLTSPIAAPWPLVATNSHRWQRGCDVLFRYRRWCCPPPPHRFRHGEHLQPAAGACAGARRSPCPSACCWGPCDTPLSARGWLIPSASHKKRNPAVGPGFAMNTKYRKWWPHLRART